MPPSTTARGLQDKAIPGQHLAAIGGRKGYRRAVRPNHLPTSSLTGVAAGEAMRARARCWLRTDRASGVKIVISRRVFQSRRLCNVNTAASVETSTRLSNASQVEK